MKTNGFIIDKGVLKAYIGNPDITELVIPEGVVTIQEGIFQEQVGRSLTIRFPSSFESVSPDAFKKGNISNLDFSKCSKIKDFSKIVLKGYFNEVILPTSIVKFAICDRNFYVSKIKVSDGENIYDFGDFSHCKNLKEVSFKGVNCSANTFVLPDNLKTFEQGGLSCQNIKISAKSHLEKLDVHDLNYIGIPASVKELSTKNVKYVFFAKSALDTRECASDAYSIDNVDIENIIFKDEMSEKGVKYFETSRGLVITDLDNDIAKFSSVPTEYNNKKIIAFSMINPFENDNGYYDEKLGAIKTEMKYMVNQNLINSKELIKTCYGKSSSGSFKDIKSRKRWFLTLGCGLLAFVICVLISFLINKKFEPNSVAVGFYVFLIVSVVAYFIFKFTIKGEEWRKSELRTRFKETSVYKTIDEPYRLKAIEYISKEINQSMKKAREDAQKRYANEKFYDEVLHGSKEERQRKELASKLDEINRNLRDSNSSGSYDLYDNNGNKVGRIDKKD